MGKFAKGLCLGLLICLMAAGSIMAGQSITVGTSPGGVTLLDQNNSSITLRLDVGTVDLASVTTREGQFTLMTADGFTLSHRIGEPSLPMVNKLISIPFGCELQTKVVSSKSVEISLESLGLTDPLMPAQAPLSKSTDPSTVPFEYNQGVYAQDGFYTLPLAESGIQGVMRGIRLGMVSIAPVEYNPTKNIVRVYTEIVVTVTFEHPDWVETQMNWRKGYSPYFEPVNNQVINYPGQFSSLKDNLVKYPVKYLIISNRMFEAQLQPFIEWKTKKGFTVITAYTDVIGTSNTAIKAYIQSQYNAGTPEDPAPSFVLLVGDAQQIPPFAGSAGSHITDLRLCEFTGDNFPEIYYGRFSAQTTSDLQPQIDKTLEYEQFLMPDPSYLTNNTLIAGVDAGYAPTYGNGQINYGTTQYFNAAHNINPSVWLYPASAGAGAASAIIQTVNTGIGFMNYTAHGSHEGHADPSFERSDLPGLTANHKYLLAIGNCCLTNTFGTDYSTPCFGEAFMQLTDKGGIGYIGGTNSTYWDEDYWWGVGYGPIVAAGPTYEQTGQGAYDGVFHDHGEPVSQQYVVNDALIFAGNMAVTESGSSRTQYYWEIYTLMGDPSVMTYLGTPQQNNVMHDAAILMTAPSITVSADPGSYVGISIEGELKGAGYVDETGQATITLSAIAAPGTADIVVTCQNRIPYISTIQVITPSGPYVIYNATTLNDTQANGNGIVENGETIQMGLTLVNVGPDVAYDVVATVSTSDPYVTVTDGTEPYGTIVNDWGTGYVENGFAFQVASDVPDKHKIVFDLSVTGTARDTWTGSFQVAVKAPVLEFVSASINDAIGGDNNGVLDPGETAEVTVTLRNTGTGQAFSTTATLNLSDQYVSVLDAFGTFGTIDSVGGTANNSADSYELTADAGCPIGYGVPVSMQVDAGGGYTISLPFNITVGDRVAFYVDDFAYDQGWTGLGGTAEWQMGPVAGAGGDPSEDHSATSDNQILGNDLTTVGTYSNSISGTQWVTSPMIDCGSMSGVILSFYRQLGIESASYDHAYFEAYDGTAWVRLYENPGTTVQETSWGLQEYDLSTIADSNPNFQIRFGLGSTDGSQVYAGWNIDDIEIKGYGRIGYPQLVIDESTLTDSLQIGEQVVKPVAIKNDGAGTLRIWFTCTDSWVSFNPAQQILAPGDSIDFNVTLQTATLGVGDHLCEINWTSNDANAQNGSIAIFMHIYVPDISLAETTLEQTLPTNTQQTYPLTITNNGPGRLLYQVGCQMNQKAAISGQAVSTQTLTPLGYQPADGDKSDATEPFFTEQNANFGGPDIFGHSWVDSDEQGGPAFGWVDISAVGTAVTLGDDNFVGPIPIGFGFPYYDSVYTQLYIGSNGIVTFDAGLGSRANAAMPVATFKSLLAMWWDDLDPRKGGNVYYYYDMAGGRFIVSFVDIKFYYSTTGTGSTNFQAILNSDGTILLQYGVMNSGVVTLQSSTIGIQNAVENDALQILYNAPYMHDNLAIAITAQHWLSALPAGGVIEPFSNATVTVKFDATDMPDGNYTGAVSVSSNDPDSPVWSIPTTMQVMSYVCGDVDGNLLGPDIGDLVFLVEYSFNDGTEPPIFQAADMDSSGSLDIGDLVVLVEFSFNNGPAPNCP